MTLARLKPQSRSRLKLKSFQMTRNPQRGKYGMRVNIATLGNEMPTLLEISEQADHNNILFFGNKIATLWKGIEAPLCATNASLNPVRKFRWPAAARGTGLLADRSAQHIQAGNQGQRDFRTPRFDVDQLKHVSALANIGADPLAIPAGSIGPRKMESAVSNRDLVASTPSGAVTDRSRPDPNTGEGDIGTKVASCAGLRIGVALNIGDTERGYGDSRPCCAGRRSQQHARTHQFPHTLRSHSAPRTIQARAARRPAIDTRQPYLRPNVVDAAQRHRECQEAGT